MALSVLKSCETKWPPEPLLMTRPIPSICLPWFSIGPYIPFGGIRKHIGWNEILLPGSGTVKSKLQNSPNLPTGFPPVSAKCQIFNPVADCMKPLFTPGQHTCNVGTGGGIWESSRHTPPLPTPHLPSSQAPTHLPPYSTLLACNYTPPLHWIIHRYPNIVPSYIFSYLDCLRKLKWNLLEGSLSCFGVCLCIFRISQFCFFRFTNLLKIK